MRTYLILTFLPLILAWKQSQPPGGLHVDATKPECESASMKQIVARFSSAPRISKTELSEIKNFCGRGFTSDSQRHAYLARVFLGPRCAEPGCKKGVSDQVDKLCDGVFISNIHVLTSSNCFRTFNHKQAYYEIRGHRLTGCTIYRAVGPISYEEQCFVSYCNHTFYELDLWAANDFVILTVQSPGDMEEVRPIVCLPTKQMMREIANMDTKLASIAFHEGGVIMKEEIDAKLKRINCSETSKSCSYFEVETPKSRSELSDGTPLVFAQDRDGAEAGKMSKDEDNDDFRHYFLLDFLLVERMKLIIGNAQLILYTYSIELAVHEQFGTSERDDSATVTMEYYGNKNGFELYAEFKENNRTEQSFLELWEELNSQTAANYSPELRRLSKAENEDLQNSCGKDTPKPMINFGTNMSTSQFVVGIGKFLSFPMDYSYGPTCSGVIISSRHVLTADHCVDSLKYDPSRVYVSYASNCFNPIFSRNNYSTYANPQTQVPCGNSTQRIAFVKHIITQKDQLFKADCEWPTNFEEREGEFPFDTRNTAAGDLAILELREDIIVDSHTTPICMPRHNQEYQDENLTIYGVGGETRTFDGHMEFSMEGLITRLIYSNQTEGVRIGRDHDYWVEMDDFEFGMSAIDFGDSGGPWTRKSSEGRDVLVSLTSAAMNLYLAGPPRFMLSTGPDLEKDSDFICKWTGICPEGADAERDKQETNVDGVQYCGELPTTQY